MEASLIPLVLASDASLFLWIVSLEANASSVDPVSVIVANGRRSSRLLALAEGLSRKAKGHENPRAI